MLETVKYYYSDLFSVEIRSEGGNFIDSIKVDLKGRASETELRRVVEKIYGSFLTKNDQRTLSNYIGDAVKMAYMRRNFYGLAC